jgi:hypothetical protein
VSVPTGGIRTGETAAGGIASDVVRGGGAVVVDVTPVADVAGSAVARAEKGSGAPGNGCGRTPLVAHAAVVIVTKAILKSETLPDTRTILCGYRPNARGAPEVNFLA